MRTADPRWCEWGSDRPLPRLDSCEPKIETSFTQFPTVCCYLLIACLHSGSSWGYFLALINSSELSAHVAKNRTHNAQKRLFELKIRKIFWREGHSSLHRPFPSRRGHPSPHSTLLGAFGSSILALTVLDSTRAFALESDKGRYCRRCYSQFMSMTWPILVTLHVVFILCSMLMTF